MQLLKLHQSASAHKSKLLEIMVSLSCKQIIMSSHFPDMYADFVLLPALMFG